MGCIGCGMPYRLEGMGESVGQTVVQMRWSLTNVGAGDMALCRTSCRTDTKTCRYQAWRWWRGVRDPTVAGPRSRVLARILGVFAPLVTCMTQLSKLLGLSYVRVILISIRLWVLHWAARLSVSASWLLIARVWG